MSSAPMKIDAFKVYKHKSPDLQDIFEKMLKQKNNGLATLNRMINGREIRYEDIEKKQVGNNTYWLIDFVVLTDHHGPDKASPDNPLEPFDFEEDEKFGYDTAVLYDPDSDCIMIQYNHQGVKSKGISDYLIEFDKTQTVSYDFKPIIRKDLAKVLLDKPLTKKVEIGIDTRYFDINASDSSVNSTINQLQSDNEVSQIYISVSARGGKKEEIPENSQGLFSSLRKMLSFNSDGITMLKQSVSDGESAQEILDFIEAKLSKKEIVKISDGHRFARKDRWNALIRAFNEWNKNGELN